MPEEDYLDIAESMRDMHVALVGLSDAEEARALAVLRLFRAPPPCAPTAADATHIVLGSTAAGAAAEHARHAPPHAHVVALRWLTECERRAAVLDCQPFVLVPACSPRPSQPLPQPPHSSNSSNSNSNSSSSSTAPATQTSQLTSTASSGTKNYNERTFLQGRHFVSAGFSAVQTARNRDFVAYLGGTHAADDGAATSAAVDYVVMPHGVAAAAKQAVHARYPRARLVSPQWLELSHRMLAVLDVALSPVLAPLPARLPLAGMAAYTLSLSGFLVREKPLVVVLAHDMGAACTEDFCRARNNLLVCRTRTPTSDKYRAARRWHIPVVPVAWLNDSAARGRVLPVDDYRIDTAPDAHDTAPAALAAPAAAPSAPTEPLVVESSTTAVLGGTAADNAGNEHDEGGGDDDDDDERIENALVHTPPSPSPAGAGSAAGDAPQLDPIIWQCVDDISGRSTGGALDGIEAQMARASLHRFTPVRKRARADRSLVADVPSTLSTEDQQSWLGTHGPDHAPPLPPAAAAAALASPPTSATEGAALAPEGDGDSLSQQCSVRYVSPKEQKPRTPASSSTPSRSRRRKS